MAILIHNMIHYTDKPLKYKDVTHPHNLKVVGSNPTPATNFCHGSAGPDLLAEPPAEVTGGDTADDLIRGNVLGDECARPDDGAVADGNPAHDHGLAADPDVIAHDDRPAIPEDLGPGVNTVGPVFAAGQGPGGDKVGPVFTAGQERYRLVDRRITADTNGRITFYVDDHPRRRIRRRFGNKIGRTRIKVDTIAECPASHRPACRIDNPPVHCGLSNALHSAFYITSALSDVAFRRSIRIRRELT